MSHRKTRLPLPSPVAPAAVIALAAGLVPVLAAPLPGAVPPVSHNEQGNFHSRPHASDAEHASKSTPPPDAPCPADHDGNGAVTSADVSSFIAAWLQSIAAGDLTADFDDSGAVNSADIPAFLTAWANAAATGC